MPHRPAGGTEGMADGIADLRSEVASVFSFSQLHFWWISDATGRIRRGNARPGLLITCRVLPEQILRWTDGTEKAFSFILFSSVSHATDGCYSAVLLRGALLVSVSLWEL